MAAFADGGRNDLERAEFKRIAEDFASPRPDAVSRYQDVLLKRVSVAQVASALGTPEVRNLAYEMAVCVCDADDVLNEREKSFLVDLRRNLALDANVTAGFVEQADALVVASLPPVLPAAGVPPVIHDARRNDPEIDRMILNSAILNGALELLPEALATLAIVPLQMKMVYQVGRQHGYELDRRHITELLGAAGVGLTSQVVEGCARKLFGGLLGTFGAGVGRKVGNQVAGSATTFAGTYAMGKLAERYYAGGRTLSGLQLKELFATFAGEAKSLHSRYAADIQARAQSVNPTRLLGLIRGEY